MSTFHLEREVTAREKFTVEADTAAEAIALVEEDSDDYMVNSEVDDVNGLYVTKVEGE